MDGSEENYLIPTKTGIFKPYRSSSRELKKTISETDKRMDSINLQIENAGEINNS
jgi:hypothetical protein